MAEQRTSKLKMKPHPVIGCQVSPEIREQIKLLAVKQTRSPSKQLERLALLGLVVMKHVGDVTETQLASILQNQQNGDKR